MDQKKEGNLSIPPFVLGGSSYDLTTFVGRFKHHRDYMDPRYLYFSHDKIRAATRILDQYRDGSLPADVSDASLWKAQKIKQANIHPDTNTPVMALFRMGFVPAFASPVVLGISRSPPTLIMTTIWQSLNQINNAGFNYSNRNATRNTTFKRCAEAFFCAVISGVTIAVSFNAILARTTRLLSPNTRSLLFKISPYPAVVSSNLCNIFLMRNNELLNGIEVYQQDGKVVGTSRRAADVAVTLSAVTRILLPIPLLIFPPLILHKLEQYEWFKKRPKLKIPVHYTLIYLSFTTALPVCTALYPQQFQVHTRSLETDIRSLTTDEYLYFNKGL